MIFFKITLSNQWWNPWSNKCLKKLSFVPKCALLISSFPLTVILLLSMSRTFASFFSSCSFCNVSHSTLTHDFSFLLQAKEFTIAIT